MSSSALLVKVDARIENGGSPFTYAQPKIFVAFMLRKAEQIHIPAVVVGTPIGSIYRK
jgi:hypothetical protein